MNQISEQSIAEQFGLSYSLVGDYYLPDLRLPESPQYTIGRFGLMHLQYLKNHRRVLYVNLLTSGQLNNHLHEIDETAHDRMELICKQMAERESVTEKLKAENQMLWVQMMNNIRSRAMEIINEELIYN